MDSKQEWSMLKQLITALALSTTSVETAAKIPWLVRVNGVVCESEIALRKHFSSLPENPNMYDHKMNRTLGCRWLDVGIVYAVTNITFLTHGPESIMIGTLQLWPGDKPPKWGVVKRQPLAWLTEA